ncbi:hypothetical protein [Sulfurimonas sp.]|uniref:hypothetical protein n=1 Tax=Sulfurimonas sp. TaxID=2022749 RepID=UPI003D0EF9AB
MLRGFGKRYFTLASILAYSVSPRLHAQTTCFSSLTYYYISTEIEDEESPPNEELLLTNSILQQNKACHCNCIFKKRIRLILLLNHFIPRCPFYTKYFAFRRTGVHPPLLFLF